ncbi:MAG: hypothetical protein ACOY45_03385 [Pseudomonadota bacterium]
MNKGLAALCGTLLLCACSGGGSGTVNAPGPNTGGGSGGSPTPTPSPSPVSYQKFSELAGNQDFEAGCGKLSFYLAGPQLPAPFLQAPIGQSHILYDSNAKTYTFTGMENTSFGPGDLLSDNPPSYSKAVGANQSSLLLIRPSIAGGAFEYARAAFVSTQTTIQYSMTSCVYGVFTKVDDLFSGSGTTYARNMAVSSTTFVVTPGQYVNYSLDKSQVSFKTDLNARTVTITIRLSGKAGSGPDTDFGSYTGNGTIDRNNGTFAGNFVDTGGSTVGFFQGTFFGPQGVEYGLNFGIAGKQGSADVYSTGTLFGAR